MKREIIFDTETTGFEPKTGDRIVEIGAVELINQLPTGRQYHVYINPERDIPAEATAVHGITSEMVRDKPVFAQEYTNFLEFIGEDSLLVAHNAAFDMKFINHHLREVGHTGIKAARVIDSLEIARKKFPGAPASLDALCRRFEIDLSARTLHGALLDSQLLAEVWLELNGGRQHGLQIDTVKDTAVQVAGRQNQKRPLREPRIFPISEEDISAHSALLDRLKEPLWRQLS
jgi:DNA polymerase-3 subunit epsilon